MTQPRHTADSNAAVEVWARLLNSADIHVHGPEHPAWRDLSPTIQDQYRKAARWLTARTVIPPDVVRQKLTERAERAEAALNAVRRLHVRNEHTGTCEECSRRDYPDYSVPAPCPTIRALGAHTTPTENR